ncbi:hypothetical protein V8F06_010720 [Rhypophila decipiens]
MLLAWKNSPLRFDIEGHFGKKQKWVKTPRKLVFIDEWNEEPEGMDLDSDESNDDVLDKESEAEPNDIQSTERTTNTGSFQCCSSAEVLEFSEVLVFLEVLAFSAECWPSRVGMCEKHVGNPGVKEEVVSSYPVPTLSTSPFPHYENFEFTTPLYNTKQDITPNINADTNSSIYPLMYPDINPNINTDMSSYNTSYYPSDNTWSTGISNVPDPVYQPSQDGWMPVTGVYCPFMDWKGIRAAVGGKY